MIVHSFSGDNFFSTFPDSLDVTIVIENFVLLFIFTNT